MRAEVPNVEEIEVINQVHAMPGGDNPPPNTEEPPPGTPPPPPPTNP